MPITELTSVLDGYPNADLMWTQDEPENQGAWPFISLELSKRVTSREVQVSSRRASASPATGSNKRSATEQSEVIKRALSV